MCVCVCVCVRARVCCAGVSNKHCLVTLFSLNLCIVSVLSQCIYSRLTVSLDEPIFIRRLTTFVYTTLYVMDLTFDWCHIVLTAILRVQVTTEHVGL